MPQIDHAHRLPLVKLRINPLRAVDLALAPRVDRDRRGDGLRLEREEPQTGKQHARLRLDGELRIGTFPVMPGNGRPPTGIVGAVAQFDQLF